MAKTQYLILKALSNKSKHHQIEPNQHELIRL